MYFKKALSLLLATVLLLSLAACGAGLEGQETTAQTGLRKVQAADLLEDFTPGTVAEKPTDEAFKKAGYDWAARLFRQVYQQEQENKTLLLSPLSVMIALAMTAGGAQGDTLTEMETVLGGSLTLAELNAYLHTYLNQLPSSEKAKFSFANGIWFREQEGFVVEDAFLQRNVDYFTAAIRKAAFDNATVKEINQWVAQHTDNMIPGILEALTSQDMMVLVNALAFDAKWDIPFEESDKIKLDFTNLQGGKDSATFLFGKVDSYLESDEAIGFMKSYVDDSYRFVAMLPREGTDFSAFVKGLSGEKLAAFMASETKASTSIKLPVFSYDYEISLESALKNLGIQAAFGDADFSGISRDTNLNIGEVLHKTHIDLDSEGTRAAAVTAVMVKCSSMVMSDMKEVFLDRPFVYMIVDTETQLPLFVGSVTGFDH